MSRVPAVAENHPIPATWIPKQEHPAKSRLEAAERAYVQALAEAASASSEQLPEMILQLRKAQEALTALREGGAEAEQSAYDPEEYSLAGRIPAMTHDGKRIPGAEACANCGRIVAEGEEPHGQVKRIVRPGSRYGSATGGQAVWIEPADLQGAPLEATMSLAAHEARERRRLEPRPQPQQGRLGQMVQAGMEAVAAQTRAMIERGKQAQERDRLRAAGAAADQEPASTPARPMVMDDSIGE